VNEFAKEMERRVFRIQACRTTFGTGEEAGWASRMLVAMTWGMRVLKSPRTDRFSPLDTRKLLPC